MTWNKKKELVFFSLLLMHVWLNFFHLLKIAEATESDIVNEKIYNNSKTRPHICITLSKSYYYKYCYKTKMKEKMEIKQWSNIVFVQARARALIPLSNEMIFMFIFFRFLSVSLFVLISLLLSSTMQIH